MVIVSYQTREIAGKLAGFAGQERANRAFRPKSAASRPNFGISAGQRPRVVRIPRLVQTAREGPTANIMMWNLKMPIVLRKRPGLRSMSNKGAPTGASVTVYPRGVGLISTIIAPFSFSHDAILLEPWEPFFRNYFYVNSHGFQIGLKKSRAAAGGRRRRACAAVRNRRVSGLGSPSPSWCRANAPGGVEFVGGRVDVHPDWRGHRRILPRSERPHRAAVG